MTYVGLQQCCGQPFVKWFGLCYRTVVCTGTVCCLSVCNIGILWPNGWMDQDVLDGNPDPPKKGTASHLIFFPVYYGQTAGWIKMPLGTEVGLGPDNVVLDWDPASPLLPPQKGHSSPPLQRMSVVATVAHLSYCWALVLYFKEFLSFMTHIPRLVNCYNKTITSHTTNIFTLTSR